LALEQPDLGILRKAQRGDERAFSIIVRAYERPFSASSATVLWLRI
jgi:hypothetical protein